MKETEIKTVLGVADALGCVGLPRLGSVTAADEDKNVGFLLLLADALDLIDGPQNRYKSIEFLVNLATQLGLTNDGADAAEVTECNKRFLVGLALELCVIGSDNGRASLDYGPNYSAVELDHDLIIDLYKSPDRMDMVRAAVDAIAECTPLVVLPEDRRQIDECR